MRATLTRRILAGAGIALVFAAVAAALLRLVPQPHTPADYLIAGTAATLVALLAVFLLLAASGRGASFRRRGS